MLKTFLFLVFLGFKCFVISLYGVYAPASVRVVSSSQDGEHFARVLLDQGRITVDIYQAGLEPATDKKLFSITPAFFGEVFLYRKDGHIYTAFVDRGDILEDTKGEILIYRDQKLIRHISIDTDDLNRRERSSLSFPFQNPLGFAFVNDGDKYSKQIFFVIKDYRGNQVYYDLDTGKMSLIIGIY